MQKSKTYGTGRVFKKAKVINGKRHVSRRWTIAYYIDGVEHRERTGTSDFRTAVDLLTKRQAELRTGEITKRPTHLSFDALLQLVTDDLVKNGRSTYHLEKVRLPHLKAFFGSFTSATITTARIAEYQKARVAAGASPATVNRELASLRRAFNLAIEQQLVPRKPVFRQLTENGRTRKGFFEYAELLAVKAQLPLHLQGLIEAFYITGWRKQELLTREWSRHVDFENGELRIEPGEAKDRQEGRVFPLHVMPRLRDILTKQQEMAKAIEKARGRKVKFVFCKPNGDQILDFRESWKQACEGAGIKRIVHDFRRTAVRNLEMAGVDRPTAMKIVGHKTDSIYRRYAIVDSKMLNRGIERLAAFHRWQEEEARKDRKKEKVVPFRG